MDRERAEDRAERRASARDKKRNRHGMRVSGASVKTLADIIQRKVGQAEQAEREHKSGKDKKSLRRYGYDNGDDMLLRRLEPEDD